MSCIDDLNRAFLLSWIGDVKNSNKIVEKCIRDLKDAKRIKKDINNAIEKSSRLFEVPSILRKEGISEEDILRLTLYEFSKRISRSDYERIIYTEGKLIYSINSNGFKKILRGIEFDRKGYTFSFINSCNGFVIAYNQIIYAELLCDNIEAAIKEIIKIIG
ncbi:hypothetical protein [Acidianus brierleyi]|uniref:Uncharacterized protein n=1 Tax=Acidianus brierleyi TaxID=41673 RepID=A0A2U9IBM3_9CREN|nr:hypothetical protein [Acidianus brierleyi]AWR93426.1 hypothetical protein DFR85_01195 [Acidianus brierleyi]